MWYNAFIGGRGWAWLSSSSPGRAAIVGGRKPPSAYNKGGITMGVFTAATAYMVLGAFFVSLRVDSKRRDNGEEGRR